MQVFTTPIRKLVLCVLLASIASGSAWAADLNEQEHIAAIVVDDFSDALLVTGGTSGTLGDTSGAGMDSWLAAYDFQGNRLWLSQEVDSGAESAVAMGLASNGDCFVTGYSFDDQRNQDVWLARYTSTGGKRWQVELKQQMGIDENIAPTALAVDSSDRVVIAGFAAGTGGMVDGWVAMLDTDGELLWWESIATDDVDRAQSVIVDQEDNIFVVGYSDGALQAQGNKGKRDAWLARFTRFGHRLWLRQLGSHKSDSADAVAVDRAGGVVIAGYTEGHLGTVNAGTHDAWIARYDGYGRLVWRKIFGLDGADRVSAIVTDSSGTVYATGTTESDPRRAAAARGTDVWVAAFNPEGQKKWLKLLSSRNYEQSQAIALGEDGRIYLGGDLARGNDPEEKVLGGEAWLAGLANDGKLQWLEYFGSDSEQTPLSLATGLADSYPDDSSLTTLEILPSETDPEIDQWNDSHLVVLDESQDAAEKLFVFLPASYSSPEYYQLILEEAASLGYRAVGLNYPNKWTVGSLCGDDDSGECFGDVRREIILGQDFSDEVDISEVNGINNRLAKLLVYLNGHYQGQGWDNWLNEGNEVDWSKIILAGHSQGGGHAAMIGKLHEVARVLMFASPEDTTPTGDSPPWVLEEGITASEKYYGICHTDDAFWDSNTANWIALGLDGYGEVMSVDDSSGSFSGTRRFSTSLTPSGTGIKGLTSHSAVVSDKNVPLRSDGEAWYAYDGFWQYLIQGDE